MGRMTLQAGLRWSLRGRADAPDGSPRTLETLEGTRGPPRGPSGLRRVSASMRAPRDASAESSCEGGARSALHITHVEAALVTELSVASTTYSRACAARVTGSELQVGHRELFCIVLPWRSAAEGEEEE